MRTSLARGLATAVCLALALAGAGRASAADWSSSKRKSSKHHKKRHHKGKSTPAAGAKSTGTKGTTAAPAEHEEEEDEGGDDSGEDETADEKGAAAKEKQGNKQGGKSAKSAKSEKADSEEDSGEKSAETKDEGGEGGEVTVVSRKAKRVAEPGAGGPVAFTLDAGARGIHRDFNFHDPLSNYNGASPPYSYSLPAGPAPFVEIGLYPGAFAGRGLASRIGLVGHYEKLIGTKTSVGSGPTLSTFGQEYEAGLRVRQPFDADEVGLTVAYGKHSFHVSDTDPGPTTEAIVPNVDYTFVRIGLDGRLALGVVALGAHVGTRLVRDTGPLGTTWFPSTKTTTIEGGVSAVYDLTPLLGVVAGVDYLRYAFDFNPVPTTNAVVAGGAVDQYISGYVALRVSIFGG